MCIDKVYDKIIRNSKEAEGQYLSMATNMISSKKCNKSPLTDEEFKEQLERVLQNNVLDTDIRITGDIVNGAKQKEQPKEELGKYLEEENLAYRLNWVMQDFYKAGKDDEEREHRFKCYELFWDALEDTEFFNRLESHKEELTKLQEKCKKFVENQKEQKPAEWSESFEEAVAELIEKAKQGKCDSLSPIEEGNKLLAIAKHGKVNQQEWSEEDEKAAYFINQFLEYHEASDPTAKSCKEWFNNRFKSLRQQSKQEWSERDKYMLERVKDSVEIAKSYSDHNGECYDEELDWLKILPERLDLQEVSERDKMYFRACLDFLNNTNGDEIQNDRLKRLEKTKSWIKSKLEE